ncbi:MAG: MBG domain-containing protein [Limosilactobacillus pontis]
MINQRQAQVTLHGSQIAPYTQNTALDNKNFTVQLTNTASGEPVTVTLQGGDLAIKGYQSDYPKNVGTYDVEIRQQLINRLKRVSRLSFHCKRENASFNQ